VSPLCSRNARPKKALVGRAQWGTHPDHPEQRTQASLEGSPLITRLRPCWTAFLSIPRADLEPLPLTPHPNVTASLLPGHSIR